MSDPQHSESSKKTQKKKIKKQRQRGQEHQENFILATWVNAAQTGELYQKKKLQKYLYRDLSMIICFNYDKKNDYANTYLN